MRRRGQPCGQTPILHQSGRHHRKVSAIAALGVTPARDRVRLYFRLHRDINIDGPLVIEFLRLLERALGPLCLPWDHLQAHRARLTQEFLRKHRLIPPVTSPPTPRN